MALLPCLHGADGAVGLQVRAQPGAKRARLVGMLGDRLKIAVQAPPVDGKANVELAALLAQLCALPKGKVVLQAGATSRDKQFLIDAPLQSLHLAIAGALAAAEKSTNTGESQ